jgi:hypothetical protein
MMSDRTGRCRSVARVSLAALWLAGCGAHAFTLGAGTSTSSSASTGTSTSTGSGPSSDPSAGATSPQPWARTQIGCDKPLVTDPGYMPGTDCDASDASAYGPPGAVRGPGYFMHAGRRWTILAGTPVEEATRRARAAGFDGRIEVAHLDAYRADCKADTVCLVTPRLWEVAPGETLRLWVNHTVTISAPE